MEKYLRAVLTRTRWENALTS
ncbi:MAG: hypothetical protein ACOX2W_09475 [Desulfomonilia bacterium]